VRVLKIIFEIIIHRIQFLRSTACYRGVYVIACPSVCLSVTQVGQSKTVEASIMKFSHIIVSLVFKSKFHPEILRGSSRAWALNEGVVGKIGDFRTLSHHISETVQDRTKVAIDH